MSIDEIKVVVVIGSGPSANDISREISTIAKEVHLSSRSSDIKVSRLEGHKNIWQHTKIKRVFDDGKVEFQDGDSVVADLILHCTGFKFHFPFLRTCNMVHVDDNRVGPLYKHVFLPQLAPRLAFLGLAYSMSFVSLFLHIYLLFY
ncbi:putative flavin monooxygenase, FAD/NAD(P)-binding domain superfamily [Helianthus annuus]|nr:putative flavin monooxygenase, FAD/NAD(P)-binding domain superfamily [Helianthus annuus]KAJ0632901.1 putative flavin monooxygenase, FAD/NAD(P)-binding domain superfamily [Helianthus annuus]KAJ0636726.1 putative flavin monooxygenase, FAD/NAD(P)-binding domain superfamily [Helianthus annuus]KAJ0668156.1 putative flavin monooxygenase, FAD/NAD(P)-binding domain superfamily [Helianthus annuus]KAJ0826890.1 putative flavin monooxygenase, FAD/NAD(P)-binding domain superfamily [Helianthus annuus]